MSGVIQSIKKVFKKAGPLGKIAMVAGMFWLGGVAVNMFAGPGMSLGSAVTATNASWSSALGMTGAGGAAAPAATTATPLATAAPAAAATAAPTVTAATAAPISMETGLGLAEATNTVNAVGAGVAGSAPAAAATPGMFAGNGGLIAGMVGGNALTGYMAAAEEEERRKQEEEVRRSRGLFGVNYDGSQAGGIIRSQQVDRQTPQATVSQTVTNPGVNQPTQYTPMQPTTRPVNRNDLPALQEKGLVAQQKRQVV